MSDDDSDETFDNQTDFERLSSLRQNVNWEIEDERFEFLGQFLDLINNWEDPLPDLHQIFRKEEIDCLLAESASAWHVDWAKGKQLIDFVARSGYKDVPAIDANGRPMTLCTTAVHWASIEVNYDPVPDLFEIYDRYDVNYSDDSGLTHFHVACQYDLDEVVEKFLDLGQDPNCVVLETGDSPLHFAVDWGREDIVRLLLDRGADPNLANKKGLTPLHTICKRYDDDEDLAKLLFKIGDEKQRPVQVDARDDSGRTALQWAVATLLPDVVDVLLDRGADLSGFVFPTQSYFADNLQMRCFETWDNFNVRLASGALAVLERLERRGYEPDLDAALTIMNMYAEHALFDQTPEQLDEWRDDDKFADQSKGLMMNPRVSLHELVRLRPEQAEKLVTCTDYFRFAREDHKWLLRGRHRHRCAMCLCEKLSRRFFREWALNCFLGMTRHQLPILCCEMIVEYLMNEDLWRICWAATGRSSKLLMAVYSDD